MTRTWECKDETLYKHAHRLRRSSEDDVYFNFPWDKYLEEATSKLVYMDSNFRRPSSASDRLIKRQKDGEIIEVGLFNIYMFPLLSYIYVSTIRLTNVSFLCKLRTIII